jgi:aminoglycoside phosphotransferase (APT) family kinase protein
VSEARTIDEARLSRWLDAHLPGFAGPMTLTKFAGGQSNPTYRIDTPGGAYVLRRKPFGPLLPSAHAVDREFRLISALHPAGFPVARPLALCADPEVIGSIFYVMELVEGRLFWNAALPDATAAERRTLTCSMVETLARLHSLDPVALGLGDFGKPGNYFARQVERWTRQYRAAQTEPIPAVERLIEWLPHSVPAQERSAILHGDYRIDNLIFAHDAPRVRAVLDWELATIGDPLADFAYMAMNWVMPADGRSGIGGIDLAAAGIPGLDEITTLYCGLTGRDGVPDLHWYFAFNLFRLVGIVQGIRKRIADGNASSLDAEAAAARVVPLADAAWAQARQAGAPA